MTVLQNIQNSTSYFFKMLRTVLLVVLLSFVIGFCMLNTEIISFKIPLSNYVIYMPLCLVIFIAPIIVKILCAFLSLLIK